MTSNKRILRLPEVKSRTGFSRSSIYAFMKEGNFPSSISLSKRTIGWLESSIDEWIDSRLKESKEKGGGNA